MAIIEKHFTAVAGKENVKEVADWMFANATEYFNVIETNLTPDDYSTMVFKKGNASIFFKIYPAYTSNAKMTIMLSNGVSKDITINGMTHSSTGDHDFISRAIKTNSGILLSFSTIEKTSEFVDFLIVSKTNTDNTGILSIFTPNMDCYLISLENSIDIANYYRFDNGVMRYTNTITSFCTIPCSGSTTDYFPNVFLTPFYEYTHGPIIDSNGNKYIRCGRGNQQPILLKD